MTIGWAATELAAEPRADWARAILEEPALAALPLTIALHLGPQRDFPEPAAGLRRDLAALDARIEARRRAGWRAGSGGSRPDLVAERRALLAELAAQLAGGGPPRAARLLIGCTVEPAAARRVWAEGEAALRRLGFIVGSIGPARGRELLLSCAPLGRPAVGRGLTQKTRRGGSRWASAAMLARSSRSMASICSSPAPAGRARAARRRAGRWRRWRRAPR